MRSPVKFDGVTLAEDERRKSEDEWLAREKARDEKRSKRAAEVRALAELKAAAERKLRPPCRPQIHETSAS